MDLVQNHNRNMVWKRTLGKLETLIYKKVVYKKVVLDCPKPERKLRKF